MKNSLIVFINQEDNFKLKIKISVNFINLIENL